MELSAGTRLGPYEILAPIGKGGMGEVYRATDTKLGREVAIKVIPETFVQDPDRMARFAREAQLLASLNHPNIAAIYGVEDRALVMELVEGDTLAGPMSLDQALPLVQQLIDALEYAHEKGIVHRDLKPANIKITPEGRVKVLDFGLAKAMTGDLAAGDPESSPTLTMRATMAGVIIGTAAYMSPEQARGKPADKRGDIFSFGVVLYELLTGRQAFGGETISDSLAVILTKEPDLQLLPVATPVNLRRMLRRCLEKDPKQRLRDIGEARILLQEATPAEPIAAQLRGRPATLPWAVAAAAIFVAGAATWAWLRVPKPVPRPVYRLTAPLQPSRYPTVVLSRDGSKVAFPAGSFGQLHVRQSDQLEARPLPGTEYVTSLVFSPDGQWLAFGSGTSPVHRQVRKIQITGGAVITVCEGNPFGLDWGSDGSIIFGTAAGLSRVSAAGGKPEILTTPDPQKNEASHRFPHILPGGEAVLFTIMGKGTPNDASIGVLSLKKRVQRVLIPQGSAPRYLPGTGGGNGYLIYWRAGSLLAFRFDPNRLLVSGSPVPVLEGIAGTSFGNAAYSVSDTGTLVFLPGGAEDALKSRLVWVDRQGKEQPDTALRAPPAPYRSPRLSPDGRLVAVSVGDRTQNHIAIYDSVRGTMTRVSFKGHADYPVWTPDGKSLTFSVVEGTKSLIFSVPVDGSRPPEQVASMDRTPVLSSWSPDSKLLAFHYLDTATDIWLLSPGTAAASGRFGPVTPTRYQETPFDKFGAQFSPDGRWFAYGASPEPGVRSPAGFQVFVQPAPKGAPGEPSGAKWQVSVDGGTGPRWSRDGRELFFRNVDKVMSVDVEPGPTFRIGSPRVLFEGRYAITYPSGLGYDVTPDGKRFLMIKSVEPQGASPQMQFVLDWFEEVRHRVQTGAATR